ncbi:MAG: multicopper oxidase domain-containing protein [Candidatus Baltobacteraceae bacterium]
MNLRQGEHLAITLINTLGVPNGNLPTPPPLQIERTSSDRAMQMPTDAKRDPYALMCNQPQLAPTPTPDPQTGRIYGYHRSPWNEANLHFHGLNTSPNQPSDDVVDVLLCPVAQQPVPGIYHYLVNIPRNEPPGAYWYHPHAHGESLYQVFQGLTGALIVHSLKPSVPDKLPNHIAIVRDAPAHQGIARPWKATAMRRAPTIKEIRPQLAAASAAFKRNPGGDPFQPPDQCPGTPIPFNTTNLSINRLALPINGDQLRGLPRSKIGLGETQYWSVVNTDAQTSLDLVLLVNGKPAPLMVTARDGVPLVVKNGHPTYQAVPMSHVFLTPAGRIEFYLSGTTAGANMVIRTRAIDTGCVGDTDNARNLFYVKVGTTPVPPQAPIPPSVDTVPQRFSDLAVQKPTRKRTFIFTEYLRADEPEPDFYITEISNPKAVEHPYRMSGPPDTVVKDGTVEEWTIVNYTNEIHAFHIHQIHFMPIAGVTTEEGLGQLVDTVLVPHGGYDASGKFRPRGVKLLMDFRARDIIGTFVYHCHFLEHEDGGMMARIQVVP